MNVSSRLLRPISSALLLLAVLVAAPAAAAQVSTPVVPTEELPRTITVTGTGTVDITPDTADISFGVYSQNESLEAAQDDNSTRLDAIMQSFTEAGIAEEDIATSGYRINVINEYDRDGNLVGVQGYEVWSEVTVTIRDISIVGDVLDQAVGAGANMIGSISFYVDDTGAAASQARNAAIENARAKADEMAEAAGVIVVGVYSIEEVSAPQADSVQYEMAEQQGVGAASDAAVRTVPVSPGQSQITVKVEIVFEIEQPQG